MDAGFVVLLLLVNGKRPGDARKIIGAGGRRGQKAEDGRQRTVAG
jgi:hypothetical protein